MKKFENIPHFTHICREYTFFSINKQFMFRIINIVDIKSTSLKFYQLFKYCYEMNLDIYIDTIINYVVRYYVSVYYKNMRRDCYALKYTGNYTAYK